MNEKRSKKKQGRDKHAPDLKRQTRKNLEFDTLLRFFARRCQTAEGRRQLLAMELLPRDRQQEHYTELDEWRKILEERKALRLPAIPAPSIFRVSPHLKPFEAQTLRILRDLLQFWQRITSDEAFAFSFGGIPQDEELDRLTERMGKLFDADGDWDEHVSPAYSRLIRQWVEADQQLEHNLNSLIRRYGTYLNEDIVFERNNRRTLAVKVDFRGRVKGILHDYSASGNTIYVEPEETIARQNKLNQIQSQIREELWRIRVEISTAILQHDIIQNEICPRLSRLDVMQALCRTAGETQSRLVMPNEQGELELWEARHPFLDEHFAEARAEVYELAEPDENKMVPLGLSLDRDLRGLIISGANTGGKTVTLKTTGLLAWMANAGLPVPVEEGSKIPYYQVILADIGDNQSLSHNLSTFASHLANLKQVLEVSGEHALILLDELGSGTDPGEGNALAQAIIDEVVRRGSHLMVTTHQQILCTMAMTHEHLDNGSTIFDPNRLAPTYRFTQGVPGRSHALDIARVAGLPEHILEAAHRLIDEDQVDIQAAIRNLQEQSRELNKQKQKMRREELRLFRRMKEARDEAENLKRAQDEVKERARARLKREVEKAERRLRETIADIGSSKQIRNASAKFAKVTKEVMEPFGEPEKIEEKLPESSGQDPKSWQEGDPIYLKTWRREGHLISIDRKKARVNVGGMTINVTVDELIHLSKSETPTGGTRVMDHLEEDSDLALSVELKLLGYRVEDALLELDNTLDRALRRGIPFLKIIHGHGGGALKAAVRAFLQKHEARTAYEVVLDPENDGTTDVKFT